MKKSTTLKALVLLLMAVLCFVMPVHAQSDGFFRGEDDSYENRGTLQMPNGGPTGLNNQTFGQPVPTPLGSGLLIMVAAGAGYAVARRKRSIRKGTTMLLALALVLGFTQCKKKVETVATNQSEGVHITLTLDNGLKYDVNTGNGEVTYRSGDKIFVGNNGKYCGTLTCDGEIFEGNINPETEDYLYFYFVSGLISETDLSTSTTTYYVSISDQSTALPVLSCGRSTQPYDSEITSYHSWLLNKCALVKFVPSMSTSEQITVLGLKNAATLNFATHTITPTDEKGSIKLYHHYFDDEHWAILLEDSPIDNPMVTIPGYSASIVQVPAITDNLYYTQGVHIDMTTDNTPAYINGVFTVGSKVPGDGSKAVYFSKGNLQYLGNADGTGTWRFADNQWDFMGDGPNSGTKHQGNVSIPGYNDYNYGSGNNIGYETRRDKASARDLFGWGTSGYQFKPYSTYKYKYGTNFTTYGGEHDISETNHDWGVYHSPVVGNLGGGSLISNTDDHWRTLTETEMDNLGSRMKAIHFYDFSSNEWKDNFPEQQLKTLAIVMGVKGIILFPDSWTGYISSVPVYVEYGVSSTYRTDHNIFDETTTITWAQMEAAGCLFMPAAHCRYAASMTGYLGMGYYWGGTWSGSDYPTKALRISFGEMDQRGFGEVCERYFGLAVRLVKDAN